MVKLTKRGTPKVPFRNIAVNEIFYYDGYYWIKIPTVSDYDTGESYNAHTIGNEDCVFMGVHLDAEVIIGDAEIITNF